MNTFIENNKKWLIFYANMARIIGWVLIILSAMPSLLIPYMISGAFREYPGGITRMTGPLIEVLFIRLPLGIIVLGVAQLIRYVSDNQYQPGWLLRHGSGILYLFAILMISGQIVRYWVDTHSLLYIEINSLAYVAVTLILIGLGKILKRIMPVIEEHRTLV